MITAGEILEMIVQYGLEFYGVYPGLYRATVTRNDDPKKVGRIQARVASIHESAPNVWIKPSMMGAGKNRGPFNPPEVGDSVFVSFAQGKPGRPEVYLGGWFGWPDDESEVPSELGYSGSHPDIRGVVTRMGHVILLSDADGDERVELIWNKPNSTDEAKTDRAKTATRPGSNTQGGGTASLKFTPEGSVEITDNANPAQTIKMDARSGTITLENKTGAKVVLDSTGATIDGAQVKNGENATASAVKGESLIQYLSTHTHTHPIAPTGPPATPPTSTLLATKVKVE
jgi:hypothetical protein